jgi:hypothetical protein
MAQEQGALDMNDELDPHTEAAIVALKPKKQPEAMNSEQLSKQAERKRLSRFYNCLRQHFPPSVSQDFVFLGRVEWRLRDEGILIRYPAADPNDKTPAEKVLPDKEAIELLLQPGNPDEVWLRRANSTPAPITPSMTELQYAWTDLPPVCREMVKLASHDKKNRELIFAIARIFAIKPIDYPAPGEPPACAAEFFGSKS